MSVKWIKPLFIVSGIYDLVLGAAFLLFSHAVFARAGVALPDNTAYLHFPALLILLFAVMYLRIAGDPQGRRELIPYGMGLKVAYIVTVFWHQLHGGMPSLWIPWAWADLVFLLLFIAAWRSLKKPAL
jgi:hypothetical protein